MILSSDSLFCFSALRNLVKVATASCCDTGLVRMMVVLVCIIYLKTVFFSHFFCSDYRNSSISKAI